MNIFEAVEKGKSKRIQELLNEGVDINSKDDQGYTPLIRASLFRGPNMTNFLLKSGADVNVKNNDGRTALSLVSRNPISIKILKLLLEAGADVNTKDSIGWTPLHMASAYSKEADIEKVKILLEAGANVDAKENYGWTPLQLAIHNSNTHSNLETVKLLLDAKSNLFYKNSEKTSLDLCPTKECQTFIEKEIWKKLYSRDLETAKRYSKSGNVSLPVDVWELILLNKRQQQLCTNLSSTKNQNILELFAVELGIPVKSNTTKAQLCGIISRQLAYGKFFSEKSSKYTKEKIQQDFANFKRAAKKFGLNINRPMEEILKDLSKIVMEEDENKSELSKEEEIRNEYEKQKEEFERSFSFQNPNIKIPSYNSFNFFKYQLDPNSNQSIMMKNDYERRKLSYITSFHRQFPNSPSDPVYPPFNLFNFNENEFPLTF